MHVPKFEDSIDMRLCRSVKSSSDTRLRKHILSSVFGICPIIVRMALLYRLESSKILKLELPPYRARLLFASHVRFRHQRRSYASVVFYSDKDDVTGIKMKLHTLLRHQQYRKRRRLSLFILSVNAQILDPIDIHKSSYSINNGLCD